VSVNQAFKQTIELCSTVQRGQSQQDCGTWITEEMREAYIKLHHLGLAHSVEVWQDQELVGGLYGVVVGSVFCGESMFHLKPNASRVAYAALVDWLKSHGAHFIDCQMQNDFLETLGVSELPRELYLQKLLEARQHDLPNSMWQPQLLPL
jgi:leucyl/phenylalanyl-tRNA--protein transferase